MPLLVRVMIRTALLQLVLGVLLGALLLVNAEFPLHERLSLFVPVFYHVLMVGWITQLIGGVALWMFPVLTRERPRGDERPGWFAYVALNSGLLLRAVAEPAHTAAPHPWWGGMLAASALLQVLAVWVLVLMLWPRVKQRPVVPRRSGGAS